MDEEKEFREFLAKIDKLIEGSANSAASLKIAAEAIEKQAETTAQAVNSIALLLDVLAGDEDENEEQEPQHL
jgi:hypothetical protein